MAFAIVSATASAAIATNGTFTITAPSAAQVGAIKNKGGHTMVVRGLQGLFKFPADFTISWSGATGTVTYKGTTTIPAGSVIQVQLEMPGDDTNYPYHGKNVNQFDTMKGAYRGSFGEVFRVDFGAPAVSSTTALLTTTAVADTTLHTFTTPYVCDVPRNLQVVSSSTDTAVITIRGYDEYGVAMTESFTLNSGTPVFGLKAFKTVVSYQAGTAMSNNLSIGTGPAYGLPYYLAAQGGTGIGSILRESQDGAAASAGTAVGGVLTAATATTGDVRGTITPNTTADGAKVYDVYMFVADPNFLGVPQYAG
jgi:hypothetical protein